MNELRRILHVCRATAEAGLDSVLATIVDTEGSSYRRPGARMLFPEDGPAVGLISGGCLEQDLAQRAVAVLDSGSASTVIYDMRSPDDIVWGLGLGCNGEVRVLLERLDAAALPLWLQQLERCCDERTPAALATLFEGPPAAIGRRLILDGRDRSAGDVEDRSMRVALESAARQVLAGRRSRIVEVSSAGEPVRALIEYVAAEISLLVFGAGRDALPLCELGARLGWHVTVLDHRPALAHAENFPWAERVLPFEPDRLDRLDLRIDARTAAVVMTHHFLHDLDLLEFLLPSPLAYLGCLGPRQRTRNLLLELSRRGIVPTAEQGARLYGPVGLDIGSETPEEIALSALGEIRAVFSERRGGSLRDRPGPLHEERP